jgi:hypothetical protein
MCDAVTPYNSPKSTPNSSNSSIDSIISYNVNFSNTIPNTNATKPLILYTCKCCSNNISKNVNIYRGYNHSFCSNYCRSNYSQKIASLDYYLNNYDLWL